MERRRDYAFVITLYPRFFLPSLSLSFSLPRDVTHLLSKGGFVGSFVLLGEDEWCNKDYPVLLSSRIYLR